MNMVNLQEKYVYQTPHVKHRAEFLFNMFNVKEVTPYAVTLPDLQGKQ